MSNIGIREEISPIGKNTSLLSVGRKSLGKENYPPIEFRHGKEKTRCYEEDDCFERDVNHDTRSERSVYRDEITNDRQPFDVSQINDEGKSEKPELEGHQAHESGQSLRRKGTDDALNNQRYHDRRYDTKANSSRDAALHQLGKSMSIVTKKIDAKRSKVDTVTVDIESMRQPQRIIDLYELGRNRVISNRAIAATNLREVDDLAANVAALSETKPSVSEIAGRRLFIQAKQSAERREKFIQLLRENRLKEMELMRQERRDIVSVNWNNFRESQRINNLYELGKKRVMAKRELATNNADIATDNIKIACTKPPQRVVDLYELSRRKVIIDRKVAGVKFLANESSHKINNERLDEKQHIVVMLQNSHQNYEPKYKQALL